MKEVSGLVDRGRTLIDYSGAPYGGKVLVSLVYQSDKRYDTGTFNF